MFQLVPALLCIALAAPLGQSSQNAVSSDSANAAEAPAAYVRQLALYRAVLGKLYPQRPVRAALLWTETPELMEISTPALEAQLATIIPWNDRA